MAPHPAKPKGGSGLLIALLALVGVAGAAGFLAARSRRARHADAPTTAPTTAPAAHPATPTPAPAPVAALPSPAAPVVDASIAAAPTVDVPAVAAAPDAGAAVVAAADVAVAPTVVAESTDAGSAPEVEEAPEAPTEPAETHAAAPARPRPATQRPAARPVVRAANAHPAGDGGVATTPLSDAMRRQDWAEARRLLTAELRSRPNDAAGHAQLGYVCDRLGDSRAALNEYRAATRIDRRNTRYFHRLADLQVATGDRPGAIATLQQILRINPQEPAARARLDQMGAH